MRTKWLQCTAALLFAAVPLTSEADVPAVEPTAVPTWAIPHGGEFWRKAPGGNAAGINPGEAIARVRHAFREQDGITEATSDAYRAQLVDSGARLVLGGGLLEVRTASIHVGDVQLAGTAIEPWVVVGNTAQRLLPGAGAIVEHFEARPEGLELSWVLPERPAASGDLWIDLALDGMAYDGRGEMGHLLASGGTRARIGETVAVDAKGRRWVLESHVAGGVLQIAAPAAVLADASYPLAIDPLFGTAIPVRPVQASSLGGPQNNAAIASDGSGYFVVWTNWTTPNRVEGTRVDADGRVLDPGGVEICTACTAPEVAYEGGRYLVVWKATTGSRISARLFHADTIDAIGTTITVATSGLEHSVAGGFGRFAVAYTRTLGTQPKLLVQAVRMDGILGLLDVFDDHPDMIYAQPSITRSPDSASYPTWYVAYAYSYPVGSSHPQGKGISFATVAPDVSWGAVYFVAHPDHTNLGNPAIAAGTNGPYVAWEQTTLQGALLVVGSSSYVFDPSHPLPPPTTLSVPTIQSMAPDLVWVDGPSGGSYWATWHSPARPISVRRITGGAPSPTIIEPSSAAPTLWAYWPAIETNGEAVFVVWTDDRNGNADIWGDRIDTVANALDDPDILVSTALDTKVQRQINPDVASTREGMYLVVWEDLRNGQPVIYGTRVEAENVLDPKGILISDQGAAAQRPAVAWQGETFFVVWEQWTDADKWKDWDYARDPNSPKATFIAGTTVANDGSSPGGGYAISDKSDFARTPDVAFHPRSGRYLVTWVDGQLGQGNIYFRDVDAGSQTLGQQIVAGPYAATDEWDPTIAASEDWILLAFSTNQSNGFDNSNVMVRQMNYDPATGLFSNSADNMIKALDEKEPGAQLHPALTVNHAGWFMLALTQQWHFDPAQSDIFALEIDPAGPYEVSHFDISNHPGIQQRPAIAPRADLFVVAWEDQRYGYPRLWSTAFSRSGTYQEDGGNGTESGYGLVPAVACSADEKSCLMAFEKQWEGIPSVWAAQAY